MFGVFIIRRFTGGIRKSEIAKTTNSVHINISRIYNIRLKHSVLKLHALYLPFCNIASHSVPCSAPYLFCAFHVPNAF